MSDAHWLYVILAYGVSAAVVGALVVRVLLDYRRLRAELSRYDRDVADEIDEVR